MRQACGRSFSLSPACFVGLLLAGLLLAAPALVLAQPAPRRETAAVLDFEVKGTRDVERQLESDLRDAVAGKLPLVPRRVVDDARAGEANPNDCDESGCARRIGKKLGVRWLLRGRARLESGNYDIEVRAIDVTGKTSTLVQSERCTLCGWAEARQKATQLAAQLADAIPELPGAVIPSPEDAAKKLAGDKPPVAPTPRLRPLSVVKWVVAAAAVGLLVTGSVMLAYDGRDTCDPMGTGRQCPHFYNTAVEGGVILGAGALAAGAAAAVFVLDYRQAHRHSITPEVTPVVAPGARGALFGLSGDF